MLKYFRRFLAVFAILTVFVLPSAMAVTCGDGYYSNGSKCVACPGQSGANYFIYGFGSTSRLYTTGSGVDSPISNCMVDFRDYGSDNWSTGWLYYKGWHGFARHIKASDTGYMGVCTWKPTEQAYTGCNGAKTMQIRECEPGYYIDNSKSGDGHHLTNACTICPAGTYQGYTGTIDGGSAGTLYYHYSTSCTKCAAGTYSSATGATSSTTCSACTGRTKYSAAGASSCSTVSTGYYTTGCSVVQNMLNNTVSYAKCTGQSQCLAGYYCSGGIDTQCPVGFRDGTTKGTTSVSSCVASVAAGKKLVTTAATSNGITTAEQQQCATGTYSVARTVYHPSTSYTSSGAEISSCTACSNKPANSYYTSYGTSSSCPWACNSATKGTGAYSASVTKGTSSCTYSGTCNANYYKPTASGSTINCTPCGAGYHTSANNTATSCDANTYTITYTAGQGGSGDNVSQSVTYNSSYTTKDSSTFTKANATFAGWKNTAGTYYSANTTYSSYSTIGNITLVAQWNCNAGYTLNSSTGACDACAAGTYKSAAGNGSCTACSGRNQYQNLTGQTSCKTVDTGYYTTGCNSSNNNCTGQSQCSGATYCANGVQTSCPAATSGWTRATGTGWTAATNCYQYRTPAHCTSGQVRQYAVSDSVWGVARVSTQLTAAAGYYSSGPLCLACPSSYPNSAAGSTSPNDCYLTTAAGKYVENAGDAQSDCPAGSYCPGGTKVYFSPYVFVNYITTSNDASINTQLPLSATGYKIKAKMTPTSTSNIFGAYYGIINSVYQRYYASIVSTSSNFQLAWFNNYPGYGLSTFVDGSTHEYDVVFTNGRQTMSKDGVLVAAAASTVDATKVATQYNYTLPAARNATVYHMQWYDAATDALLRNFIPAYNTKTQSYGMYDTVTNIFFGNGKLDASINASATGGDTPSSGSGVITGPSVSAVAQNTPGVGGATACAAGSYNSETGQTKCIACGETGDWGKTTTGAGQTSCNADCANNDGVKGWATATWNSNNTITDLCTPNSCLQNRYLDSESKICPTCDSFANGLYPFSSASGTTKGREACFAYRRDGYNIRAQYDETWTPCSAGYFYKNKPNAANPDVLNEVVHYGETYDCKTCADNTYSTGGASECTPCLENYTTYGPKTGPEACRILCRGGTYLATANATECIQVGAGYWAPQAYVPQGDIGMRNACINGTTVGFGPGADEAADCGPILRVGDARLYLRSEKKTPTSMAFDINGTTYYANMSTDLKKMSNNVDNLLKIGYNDNIYTVYDDSGEFYVSSVMTQISPNLVASAIIPANINASNGMTQWSATLSDGTVVAGNAMCDATTATNGDMSADGFAPAGSGAGCWCNITMPAVGARWVFASSLGDTCPSKCAYICANNMKGSSAKNITYRTNLYNTAGIAAE